MAAIGDSTPLKLSVNVLSFVIRSAVLPAAKFGSPLRCPSSTKSVEKLSAPNGSTALSYTIDQLCSPELPATSVTTARNVCNPVVLTDTVQLVPEALCVCSLSRHTTCAPSSTPLKLSVNVLSFVIRSAVVPVAPAVSSKSLPPVPYTGATLNSASPLS